MKMLRQVDFMHRASVSLLAFALILSLAACGQSVTPTGPPTPIASSPISPAPVTSANVTPAPSPGLVTPTSPAATVPGFSVNTSAPAVTPTPSSTLAITPKAAGVKVTSNRISQDFPNKITFSLEGSCAGAVKTIYLEYGTEEHSVVDKVSRVEPPHSNGADINTSYTWEMKKTGSIPPGATVWWRWRVTDAAGGTFTSPQQTVTWEDSRFSWQIQPSTDMDLYYINQPASLMKELMAGLESNLSRVKLVIEIPKERKPRIYVYSTSEQIKGAMLFAQDWTGAVAYPSYNIILTAVNSSNLDWAKGAIAHEITHLRVAEAVFGPFGDLPTWLNEGLAEYASTTSPDKARLDAAVKDGNLISVRSLSGSFPSDSDQAHLAYVESRSIVGYLVDSFGWDKMQQLLDIFKDGSTYDNALKKIYGFDQSSLDSQWKASIGTK